MGNAAPSDSVLAKCVGSPAPDPLFELYRSQIQQLAAETHPDQPDARKACAAQLLGVLEYIYGLAQEFAPENAARLTEYLFSRRVVYRPHPTVQ